MNNKTKILTVSGLLTSSLLCGTAAFAPATLGLQDTSLNEKSAFADAGNWNEGGIEYDTNDDGTVSAIPPGPTYDPAAYTGTPVENQMKYAHTYWNTQGPPTNTYLPDVNCAAFTSQTLKARGWTMNPTWYDNGANDFSSAWVSSTALRNYIASTGAAVELNDTQRAQVKIGDVVQFDWDNSGDRDHTAVVSKIEKQADGHIKIYVIEHTDHAEYRDVDTMINVTHPGATVYYWSIS